MQRITKQAARMFKTLAGQDCDEPLSPWVIALYGYLLLVALALFFVWVSGAKL
jgi:hypothetical protein